MSNDQNICTPVTTGDLVCKCPPPWFVNGTEFSNLNCTFKMLNCGENAFREVYRAIKAAKRSVNYITWGFQPSMHFIRDGGSPPIGRLLEEVALRGVKVRVLGWATHPLGIDLASGPLEEPNTPGRRSLVFPFNSDFKRIHAADCPNTHTRGQYDFDWWWFFCYDSQQTLIDEAAKGAGSRRILDKYIPPEQQDEFIKTAIEARHNLEFRSRDLGIVDRVRLLRKSYTDPNIPRDQRAIGGIFPSHHQKMVLIDVESPENHVAFVMGHNTLDEYWDTPKHGFYAHAHNRGRNGENARQDISSRVSGPIVGDLYLNFKQAWEKTTYKTMSFYIKKGVDEADEAVERVSNVASDAGRAVSNAATDAWDATSNAASDVATGVSNTTSSIWTSGKEVVSDAWDATSNAASDVWDAASNKASDAWDATSNAASDAKRAVSNTAASAWDTVAFWKSDQEKQANAAQRRAEEQRIATQRDAAERQKQAQRAAEERKKQAERAAEEQRKQAQRQAETRETVEQRQAEKQQTAEQRQAAEQEKQAQRQAEEQKAEAKKAAQEERRRVKEEQESRIRREPLPQLAPSSFKSYPLYTSKLVACEGKEPTPENIANIKSALDDITTAPSGGAMILRTQTEGTLPIDILGQRRFDIRDTYLHVVKMATQYIYIENQYFRWPPLADAIKQAAQVQTGNGRDPAGFGSLYVFVVTNSSVKGIGAGTQKTYEMLDSLGRAETIPKVARQIRINDLNTQIEHAEKDKKAIDKALAKQEKKDPSSSNPKNRKLREEQAEIDKQLAEMREKRDTLTDELNKDEDLIKPEDRPGLKFHICTLVPPDMPDGKTWNDHEVYIHTKLMMINDTYMTLGSANINTRSMERDTELNIAHSRAQITMNARKELWAQHTGGRSEHNLDQMPEAFDTWDVIIDQNRKKEAGKHPPLCSLRGFRHTGTKISAMD